MIQRVIISGGGTGGHIFPAISIADAIRKRYPEAQILFIGAEGRMEMERVPQAGYPIKGLPVEGLKRKRMWENFRVVWNYLKSRLMGREIIRGFAPQVVIGVGGYASAPTLKAAQAMGIPTLIQEQNSYAGVTNRLASKRANTICVAYPEMHRFFAKEKLVLTGNPIRPQIEHIVADRQEALDYFGLPQETQKVVLVIGGSLGALSINESIGSHLSQWASSGATLIWQTGKGFDEKAKTLLEQYNFPHYQSAFISRMDYAYQLADVVISRAGASSISELSILGKSSILIPSPNVAEDHQTKNALSLSQRGAAILIPDSTARTELTPKAIALLTADSERESLSSEIRKFAYPEAAERIVDEIEKLCQ